MNKMVKKLKKTNLVKWVSRSLLSLLAMLPVRKKLVLFESFSGKQYSCNPRAIYEHMVAENPDFDLIWSVNKRNVKHFEENDVPYVKRLSFKWFLIMARAKYWVSNSRMPNWVKKPNHTIYLQTWHGTPLKKLVADMEEVKMPGVNKDEYIRNFHKEVAQWDYLISPNHYSTEIFKRAFDFKNKLLETGYPRNDALVNHNHAAAIKKIKEKFSIPESKKVILYAPTWRDHHNSGPGDSHFDLQLDLKQLQASLGQEYMVLLRLHSFISKKLVLDVDKSFAIDVSNYYDINELYLISDLLITDYSSVFFDYAILKRPILFFTYDLEEYRDDIRGFYFSLETEAPGPLVKTTSDLIKEIQSLKNPINSYEAFRKKFLSLEDGYASKRVVNEVFNMKGE